MTLYDPVRRNVGHRKMYKFQHTFFEFCTPRYIMTRELGMEKLRIGWGIRTKRYKDRIKAGPVGKITMCCWKEKERDRGKERYDKEREKYYNRNGWSLKAVEEWNEEERSLETELIKRERDIQGQEEESRIIEAKYNVNYREKGIKRGMKGPKYLRVDNIDESGNGDGIRALVNLRCGNMEETNKYWREDGEQSCVFCEEGWDNLEHYIGECKVVKDRFRELGEDVENIIEKLWDDELGEIKGRILGKFWKEREKGVNKRKERKRKELEGYNKEKK